MRAGQLPYIGQPLLEDRIFVVANELGEGVHASPAVEGLVGLEQISEIVFTHISEIGIHHSVVADRRLQRVAVHRSTRLPPNSRRLAVWRRAMALQ